MARVVLVCVEGPLAPEGQGALAQRLKGLAPLHLYAPRQGPAGQLARSLGRALGCAPRPLPPVKGWDDLPPPASEDATLVVMAPAGPCRRLVASALGALEGRLVVEPGSITLLDLTPEGPVVATLSDPCTAAGGGSGHGTPGPLTPLEVTAILRREYGPLQWRPRYDPVSELVFTILSQHTSDINAERAFRALRGALPTWEQVRDAPTEVVEGLIRPAGLSRQKAPRIQAVLREITARRGGLDLAFLKDLPLEEAKAWLRSLPGVGPKTAAIVLCFSLGLPAMPVDTHVYRVARRLGLLPPRATPEEAHDLLERALPPEEVFPFHVYLITHGRRVCRARRPLCRQCVLAPHCPSAVT